MICSSTIWARFCTVMSLTIVEARIISPSDCYRRHIQGDRKRLTVFPHLRVSWFTTGSPARTLCKTDSMWATFSGGARDAACLPTASSSVYPYIFSAPAFQLVIIPSRVSLYTASSDWVTIDARIPVLPGFPAFRYILKNCDEILFCGRIHGDVQPFSDRPEFEIEGLRYRSVPPCRKSRIVRDMRPVSGKDFGNPLPRSRSLPR